MAMQQREPQMLASALAYARRGWRVFPLQPNSKVPYKGSQGFKDATTDPETIRRWWTKAPRANIGIATGSGLIVIDEDTYKGADASAWVLPVTLSASTARGGRHYFYVYDGPLPCVPEGKLAPGICIKADGGYVVASPSTFNGKPYTWDDNTQPLANFPERMARIVRGEQSERKPAQSRQHSRGESDSEYWIGKAIAHARSEGRNNAGAWLAVQLRDNDCADPERAMLYYASMVRDWDTPVYTDREALATLRSITSRPPREPARSQNVTPIRREQVRQNQAATIPQNIPATEGSSALAASEPEPRPKGKKTKEKIPLTVILAHAIAEAGEHFAVDAGGKLWAYVGGVYVSSGKNIVHRYVKRLLTGPLDMPDKWTSHQADEVVAFISVDAPTLWEQPPLDRINLRNGILNVKTRKLAPHSPDFLSPVQLPVAYDPKATCPAWEQFILETFPADVKELAWEVPAWLMTPDTSMQKAVMAIGAGGNGKSTWLTGVTAFLGKHNTSSKSLQKIESDRFASSGLVGKMANICADLPSAALSGTSMFKAITGGDTIPAEYKYGDPFDFTPFSRLIFSANTPPRSPDSSTGFYDRWVVIPFTGRFRSSDGEVSRNEMDAKLAEPRELSGLLNKALDALPRLRKAGRFTEGPSTQAALAEFRDATDPFTIWLSTECIDDPEAMTPTEDLRASYSRHCARAGHATPGPEAFSIMLTKARPTIEKSRRTFRGKLTHCYIGIGLRAES